MADYITFDKSGLKTFRQTIRQFGEDIVMAVGTDFMREVAIAENKLLFKMVDVLENAPASPVVHCKDCKYKDYWQTDNRGQWCGVSGLQAVENSDFCSLGERKEDT